jgi:hypothetical protein
MPKWKIQSVEPNTCEPPGCRYYELWDSLSPPPATPVVICSIGRICPAHAVATSAARLKLLWADGNWKAIGAYIQYQRNWFKWVNHQEWLARNPLDEFGDPQPMPPQIASFSTEPVSPGSVAAPPKAEIDDMDRIYAWNREHNNRMGQSVAIMLAERTFDDAQKERITWRFEGVGDTRVFYINSGGLLSNEERTRVQAAADIAFGPGKVVVEG